MAKELGGLPLKYLDFGLLHFWGFKVVACLPFMAHRTAMSQKLFASRSSGLSLLMKCTTA